MEDPEYMYRDQDINQKNYSFTTDTDISMLEFKNSSSSVEEESIIFICSNCKRKLFLESHIIKHEKENRNWFFLNKPEECNSYFIEPIEWMKNIINQNNGKIFCPENNCNCHIGDWDWEGIPCSCLSIIRPSFRIYIPKVSKLNTTIFKSKVLS